MPTRNATLRHHDDESPLVTALGRGLFDRVRAEWTDPAWWDVELRPEVEALTVVTPGNELLAALTSLESGPCRHPHQDLWPGTPCACQVVIAAGWQAQIAWTELSADRHLLDALGALPRRIPLDPTDPAGTGMTDPGVEELAPGLRCSAGSLRNKVSRARRLRSFPSLELAVGSGLLSQWHAHLLLSDLAHHDGQIATEVVDDVLATLRRRQDARKRSWTITEVRRCARRAAHRRDGRTAHEARKDARRRRGVRLRSTGPGAAQIIADLSDDEAVRIFNRLTGLARGLLSDIPEDTRSREQIRADVFCDLLLTGVAGERGGEEVAIVVDLDVILAGQGDAALPDGTPIDPAVARELAADRRWRLWLTDRRNRVVATSPTTYRPTAALARLIRARDRHCRYPGCHVPAEACDLDHAVPFPRGQTTAENLGALCRRHHRLKTHTDWHLTTDGHTTRWRSPAGITYTD